MDDIIKNGSFEFGTCNSDGTRFVPRDWIVPASYYCTRVSQVCDDDPGNSVSVQLTQSNWNNSDANGYPNGLPTISIQQGLDLTAYKEELVLDIEFSHSLAYNYYYTTSGEFDVLLYRATEYDLDENTFYYEDSYIDYISKSTYKMSRADEHDMCWRTSHFVVTNLDPGYYILVFATPVAKSGQTGVSDSSYNFVLDKVSGTVKETGRQVIEYQGILKNGSFESKNDSGFDDWFYDEIIVTAGSANYYGNDENDTHGQYVCEAYCDDLEYAKARQQGLKQILHVDAYCKIELSLQFQQYKNYSFAVSVYKLLGYVEYDENNPAPEGSELSFWYATEDTPCYQSNISSWDPSSNSFSNWENFCDTFGVEPGHYLLIIHPGEEKTIIDNVQVSIFTEQETGHDGLFDNPYTLEDGYFSSDKKYFFFYNTNNEAESGFILCDGDYYYCRAGALVLDEMYNNRYYHPNGRMAMSEMFIYNGQVYVADEYGNVYLETEYTSDINPYLDEEMIYGPTGSLDIIVGSSEYLYVKYIKPIAEIYLDVFSANDATVSCSYPEARGERDFVVELTGHNTGTTNITISISDEDGNRTSRDVKVTVLPNTSNYTNPRDIFIRKSIVCLTPNEKTKLDYTVLPREGMAIAMFWQSSDTTVATVDQNGYVTAKGIGECRITVYNHRLKAISYCEVSVIEELVHPRRIQWVTPPPENIQVGQEVRIPDFILCDYNDNPKTVKQDGYWTSSTPSVLSISEYGTIVGNSAGEAVITFKTPQNLDLGYSRTITVSEAQISIQDIELDVYKATLNEPSAQGSLKINHRVLPANTNQFEVSWHSSNTDLVTVNAYGLVEVKRKVSSTEIVIIRCTSVAKPSIYKECIITLDPNERHPHAIKTFTPNVSTVVNIPARIEYEVANCFSYDSSFKFSYTATINMEDGSPAPDGICSIEHREGSLIRFSASVKGRYQIKLECSYTVEGLQSNPTVYGTAYFYVDVSEAPTKLTFLEELEAVSGLGNGRYILRFFVKVDGDSVLTFDLNTGSGWKPVAVDNLMYQGKPYDYIFGENLPEGTHVVRVRATNPDNGDSVISKAATVIIPETSFNKKTALFNAKINYDLADNDLISYLSTIVSDNRLYDNEELEFTTRYKTYCHNYYNLKDMLEICIEHINEQIAASQGEMAMLSLSRGVNATAYSTSSSYTNSNYQNVTDMDYYQNECIKQLMARVIELENKLNEITSNNN